jgi:uncharacterized integral membrane protein (TIGR00698 family)
MSPGLLLAALISVVAYLAEDLEGALIDHRVIEALVIAMIIGVAMRNLITLPEHFQPGATYASKAVLETAVMILGASINAQTVFNAGFLLIVAVTAGVIFGMIMSFSLGKGLGLESRLAFLVAVGNSICGNSAIAAVAPVVKAERREVASAIGLTAVAGVIVVIILPLAVPAIGLTHYQYGIVAGMAVYAVPQVVAAAFAVSQVSGEVATLVKLMRVMFLGPVVLLTGLYMRSKGAGDYHVRRSQLLPWFVIGFFTLLLLRSLDLIPASFIQPLRDTGRILTIWAMAGLGLGVDFGSLKSVGPRVGLTSVLSMVLLVILSITLIEVLGLNG